MSEVIQKAKLAKEASVIMATRTTEQKNEDLLRMADALEARKADIIEANAEDLERGNRRRITR
ncbi:hypothetical protein ABNC64_00840 [Paenibacillus larvae]